MRDRGHGQVVVGVGRGVLGRVGDVLLSCGGVGVEVGGRRRQLHVGEGVCNEASRRHVPSGGAEAQSGRRGGGVCS